MTPARDQPQELRVSATAVAVDTALATLQAGVPGGADAADRPTALAVVCPGRLVRLGDGREWLVPSVQELRDWISDGRGHCRLLLPEALGRFLRIAAEICGRLAGGGPLTIPRDDVAAFLSGLLALNYDLTPDRVAELRLFSAETIGPALSAALGLDVAAAVSTPDPEAIDDPAAPDAEDHRRLIAGDRSRTPHDHADAQP